MSTLYYIGTLKLNLMTTLSSTGALNRILFMYSMTTLYEVEF